MGAWLSDTNELEEETVTEILSDTMKVCGGGNMKLGELRFRSNARK